MKVFKPSKAKLISTLLIIVAMWMAHKLEDLVGDPLLVRFAPQTSGVIESSGDAVEHVNKTDEADVIRAGILLYSVEVTVKASGFFNRRVLLVFALCSLGVLLAMLSFAANAPSRIKGTSGSSTGDSLFVDNRAVPFKGNTAAMAASKPLIVWRLRGEGSLTNR